MKVLIISPCGLPVPATKGGAVANLVENIIRENEKREELELTVVSSFDEAAYKKSKEYKYCKFVWIKQSPVSYAVDKAIGIVKKSKKEKRYAYKLRVIRKMIKHLKKNNYDKVVIENAGYLLRILKSDSVIKKYAGNIFFHAHNDIPDNISIDLLKQMEIILVSNYVGKKIERLAGKEIQEKFHVLYNGIDYEHFSKEVAEEDKRKLRIKYDIKETDKIILFVGRTIKEKGIEKLILAFEHLDKTDCTLLIVGTPDFAQGGFTQIDKEITDIIDNNKKIIFTGYIEQDEIYKYYGLSNVAVLPSIWNEPSGLTMVEALAAQIPLITTNVGGISENISKDYGIILGKTDDLEIQLALAIETVLSDEENWRVKAVAGSEFVKKERTVEVFYNRFCEVLK